MSLAPKKRGRLNGDPWGSESPRGKDRSERKGRYDGGFTGTEIRMKNQLMKQFCRLEGSITPAAYRESALWCACGRGTNRRDARGNTIPCSRCLPDIVGELA